MKSYLKYKGFIPVEFVENKIKGKRKSDNIGINLLIIANLILIPLNYNILFESKEEEQIKYIEEKYIDTNDISKWIKLNHDDIKSIKVQNNVGEVILTNGNTIDKLEEQGLKLKKYSIEGENIKIKVIYEN